MKPIIKQLSLKKYLQILAGLYGLIFVAMIFMLPMLVSVNQLELQPEDTQLATIRLYVVIALNLLLALTLAFRQSLGIIFLHGFALLYIAFAFMGKAPFADYGVAFHVVALLIYWKIVIRDKREKVDPRTPP